MHASAKPLSVASPADLHRLHDKIVLINSAQDRRNPPTGIRGTIEVRPGLAGRGRVVQVELDFPQMFSTRAHHRTVTLTEEEVARLLASERNGVFELTLDDRLDPEARQGNE